MRPSLRKVRRRALLATAALATCLVACGGAGGEGGASSETAGESGVGDFDVEVEVVMFETQPMVVDLIARVQPGYDDAQIDMVHAFDPGVVISQLPGSGDPLERHFRLRGLSPVMLHGVDVSASLGEEGHMQQVAFTTGSALPGYFPSLEVTVSGEPDPAYRLMDWSNFGGAGAPPVGLVAVDSEGRTRWYAGRTDTELGVGATLAGVKLMPDGNVLFQQNGWCEIMNEFGQTVARFLPEDVADNTYHHDVTWLPNGNILTIGFEFGDVVYPEGTLLVAGDRLSEITPTGEKVWEWSSLAHLDTQRRRDGFDTVFPPIIDPVSGEAGKDWSHANAVVYEASDDSIYVSYRHLDWIVKIDRASGDVVWRFGEGGDFTLASGEWFYHQHSPELQPDGSMLIYDNGNGNPDLPLDEEFSRAVRYELDEASMVATQVWEDDAPDFLSEAMGDVDRMPGGHYLINDSAIGLNEGGEFIHARVREVDPDAPSPQTVWSFETEFGRFIYRAVPTTRLPGQPAD